DGQVGDRQQEPSVQGQQAMPPTKIFEPFDIQTPGVGTVALDFNSALGPARKVRQVQIPVSAVKVPHLPFRMQMVEVANRRKPHIAQKFYGTVPKALFEQFPSAAVFLPGNLSVQPSLVHFVKSVHGSLSPFQKYKTAPTQAFKAACASRPQHVFDCQDLAGIYARTGLQYGTLPDGFSQSHPSWALPDGSLTIPHKSGPCPSVLSHAEICPTVPHDLAQVRP